MNSHSTEFDYSNFHFLCLQGPKGETMGAFVQPLPMSNAIFRAPSESQGNLDG